MKRLTLIFVLSLYASTASAFRTPEVRWTEPPLTEAYLRILLTAQTYLYSGTVCGESLKEFTAKPKGFACEDIRDFTEIIRFSGKDYHAIRLTVPPSTLHKNFRRSCQAIKTELESAQTYPRHTTPRGVTVVENDHRSTFMTCDNDTFILGFLQSARHHNKSVAE